MRGQWLGQRSGGNEQYSNRRSGINASAMAILAKYRSGNLKAAASNELMKKLAARK